jgi:hypothetical protein
VLVSISAIGIPVRPARVANTVIGRDLPEPFATPSSRNNPTVVASPKARRWPRRRDFVVEDFMDFAGMRPRFMMLGPATNPHQRHVGQRQACS